VSKWDTSNAQGMERMFRDAISFSSNLSSWNTSKLEDASEMVRTN
jgi:surface protein